MREVRDLYIRPSPTLRRRLAFAAANDDIPMTRYVRRVIERWAGDLQRPDPSPVEDESGPYHVHKFSLSDTAHSVVRIAAATHEISVSAMSIRVLDAYVPREIELLAAAVINPPGGNHGRQG